jgi:hypothetical protein
MGVDQQIGSRRYRLAQIGPLDRNLVQIYAARWFGGPPWVLSRQQPGELVFWHRLKPNMLTALLLFTLGVLSGIFYIVAAMRGTQTLAASDRP